MMENRHQTTTSNHPPGRGHPRRAATGTLALVLAGGLGACLDPEPLDRLRDDYERLRERAVSLPGVDLEEPGAPENPRELDSDLPPPSSGENGAVRAHCAALDEDTETPELSDAPPLPEPVDVQVPLPAYCSDLDIVAACDEPNHLFAQSSNELGAALEECGSACVIELAAGDYEGEFFLPPCASVVGAGPETSIVGVLGLSANNVVRDLSVSHEYSPIWAGEHALIDGVAMVAGYEGISSGFGARDVRVCRSTVAAGYSGVGISWESVGLRVAGTAISACYAGVGGSWGSSELDVRQSVIFGAYEAVGASWGTTDVTVVGNVLDSDYAAVDIHIAGNPSGADGIEVVPDDFAVLISNNVILGGSLPARNVGLGIIVEDNEILGY